MTSSDDPGIQSIANKKGGEYDMHDRFVLLE